MKRLKLKAVTTTPSLSGLKNRDLLPFFHTGKTCPEFPATGNEPDAQAAL
jgi:hypothetical protein